LLFAAIALSAVLQARGAEPKPAVRSQTPASSTRPETPESRARAERLEQMRILAGKLSFEEKGGEDPAPRHLVIERPLIHYTDSDRGIFDGTLWAYGRQGRPVAFVEMYCGRETNRKYRHAAISTCDRPLQLVGAPTITWTPQNSSVVWAPLKTETPPADEPAARLRQMKTLAQRFTAHQVFDPDEQRMELRLLIQPLHRYSDKEQKIRDGAVFAWALGTNPEALLFLEARDDAKGLAAWHYGLSRRGSAELHGQLDGKEVWMLPRLWKAESKDPFCHFLRPVEGDPQEASP